MTSTKNMVLGFGGNISDFVRSAIATKGSNQRLYCGKLPQGVVDMVKESSNYDVSGYNFAIMGDDAWHAYRNHMNDTQATNGKQVSLTPELMELLPDVIAHPDKVALSKKLDGNGRPALIFRKTDGDSVVTITGIAKGRKTINFDTMRIEKEKSPTAVRADTGADPYLTPSASSEQTSLLDPTLPQGQSGVNREDMQKGGKDASAPPKDEIHIDDRTWVDVGKRKVKAFQYDHPELHGYFAKAAKEMNNDLAGTIRGKRYPIMDAKDHYSIIGYTGDKRATSSTMETALDTVHLTYGYLALVGEGIRSMGDGVPQNGEKSNMAIGFCQQIGVGADSIRPYKGQRECGGILPRRRTL